MKIRWRGMELPSKVERDDRTLTPTFGSFSAEPFERGFGTTIGNSLRRVLLTSLEGSAVTRIKLRGAANEFASLPGMMEDVTDVVLNVKSLIVRSHAVEPRVLHIEKVGPCVVTAADIAPDSQVEIINPELVIANLTGNETFDLEMIVQNGRGYVPASEQTSRAGEDVGFIALDASYSPVVKVKYWVEETRVGQKTNYERLVIEITTDGSVDPEMALVEASKILRKQLNPFIQYESTEGPVFVRAKSSGDGVDPELERKLSMSLEDLKLSVRAMNCLLTQKITTVRDLVVCNPDSLLELRNFGDTSLQEVKTKLEEHGLYLGMRLPTASGAQGARFN